MASHTRRTLMLSAIVLGGVAVVAGACSGRNVGKGPSTTVEPTRETLPAGSVVRFALSPDLVPAIAGELIIGALQYQGATVTRSTLTASNGAEAALTSGTADVGIVITSDPDGFRVAASDRGLVVLEPLPGDVGGATGIPVATADASRKYGDLLEGTIDGVTSSLAPDTLVQLAAAIAEGERSTSEVVREHLVDSGLVTTTR